MLNPKLVMVASAALMFVATAMMVGQGEWKMLAIVMPIWLAILAFWWFRQVKR